MAWGAHLAVFTSSGLAAYVLRFDFQVPHWAAPAMWASVLVWVAAKSVVFGQLRLHRGWLRYISVADVMRLALGNVAGSALAAIILLTVLDVPLPRSVCLIDLLLCTQLSAGIRLLARMTRDHADCACRGKGPGVFIYGAGDAGLTLLRELQANPRLHYEVVGLIDDDPEKRGAFVHGVRVVGSGAELPLLAARHTVEQALIAIPSASGAQLAEILRACSSAGLRCKTIPGLGEIIDGPGLSAQIRDVAVEDLLGRCPVQLEEGAIRGKLEGKTVFVTGAAGSIGSELCRQIARYGPAIIVGLDNAETPLFHLDREMSERFPGVAFMPEVGSIQSTQRLSEVFEQYKPAVVYHAAAYKHVPMMEAHIFEAVENNVFGTRNVAAAAAAWGVEDFVMISSDKAVRPSSVMGATKRAAELLINSIDNEQTKFVSVRFGNVLGSNGSVVPLFKQQIAAGGPVTVTHPEMRRYFMTIPEAVQLVLQASTMGNGGEVFVLDMGAPVKILDLARNLIVLSGLQPTVDIKIEFTGIRPGEKLYEELSTLEENTRPTYHEKIKIFAGGGTFRDIPVRLERMRTCCMMRDSRGLILELKKLIPEYSPSSNVLRRASSNSGAREPFQAFQDEPAALCRV